MGLDHQNSIIQWLESAGSFFLAKNPDFFRKNAEVWSYIDYIVKENPDIIYITELCGVEQRDMLIEWLEKLHYTLHIEKWFELWNMQSESHRYLYHIMWSRYEYTHHETFTQYRNDRVSRYLKSRNYFSQSESTIQDKITAILDGSGSHYRIGDIEIGLLHSHGDYSKEVPDKITNSLWKNPSNHQILIWDVNMSPLSMQKIITDNNVSLERIETKRTYPYVLEKNIWILSRAIQSIAQKVVLPYPDQAYIGPTVRMENVRNLWPKETWLNTDHSINHYILKTTSQSSQ